MRKFTKHVAALLSVLMVIGSFATVSFGASAATTKGTIEVSSNVGNTVSYDYDEYDKQVTATFALQADEMILDTEATITYDNSVLSLADTNTVYTAFPGFLTESGALNGSVISNFKYKANQAKFNATNMYLYDFTTAKTYFTLTFDIIGTGNATVNLDVDVLTATTADSFNDMATASDINLVYYGETKSDMFTFTSAATFVSEEEPTGDVTIKFAAPTSSISRYDWVDPVIAYGASSSFANLTKIAMTATDEVYYTADFGVSTLLSAEGWTIYEATLTDAQVAAINSSNVVAFSTANGTSHTAFYSGSNVLKAGVDTFGAYSTTKMKIEDVNGATFVIRDAANASDYVGYKGYWVTDYTTVRFAAPVSNTQRSTWDAVEMYYAGSGIEHADATKIKMVNTFETTKVSDIGDMSTLKAGRWYIYAASIDKTQAAEINAGTRFGFSKPGDSNKTSYAKNCLLAKVDAYDGTYNSTKSTIEEHEGQVFVPQAKSAANQLLTFLGEWQTEAKYTEGRDDKITIYFAAPKSTSATSDWNTGVELYYGNTTLYKDTNRLTMTKTNKTVPVDVAGTNLTTLSSGNWDVYSLELTVEQIRAIDDSNNVGFIKTGSYNRTSIRLTRNITRASKIAETTAYSNAKETIESFDGFTFVINDLFDKANERTSYLGSWLDV